MPFAVTVITPPADPPVSLAEAKARLRITGDDEDDDVSDLIAEAVAAAEAECGRAFMPRTLSLFLDDFPRCGGGTIRLPVCPVASVTWVKYYDPEGTFQTVSGANYFTAVAGDPARIVPMPGVSWPTVQTGRPEAAEIRFVAGYADAAAVPKAARSAVMLILADRYANRGDELSAFQANRSIPEAAKRLLRSLDFGEVR